MKFARLSILSAMAFVMGSGVSFAADTSETCLRIYESCARQCEAEDPDHGFRFAKCSAGCVTDKATCEGGIIYDKSADWTKKQYDAAKPWVKEKAEQAGDMAEDAGEAIDKALENSKQEYPN